MDYGIIMIITNLYISESYNLLYSKTIMDHISDSYQHKLQNH